MDKEFIEIQKEIAGLLAILVKRDRTQSVLISEMGSVGFSPKRIADLLKTSPNTVSVALHSLRKKNKK